MENCSELDRTKPSQNAFHFPPPHRRRTLMSETYHTLIHILSHCPTSSGPQPSHQKQEETGCSESGKEITAHGALVDQHMEAEIKLVNDIDHEKNKTHAILHEMGDISEGQIKDCIDLLDHNDDAMEVNGEVPQKNGANNGISSSLVDNSQASTLVLQSYNEQEDKSNTPELQLGESDLVKLQNMDKEISVHETCATMESCFMDEDNALTQLVQSGEEKIHIAEKKVLEDMEHGLQLNEMELQNLVDNNQASTLDHTDDAMDVNGEVHQKNGTNNGSGSLVDNNQASTLVLQLCDEQEDKSNTPELQVGESDIVRLQHMDKEISIHEACATIESCFMDEENELSQVVQGGQEEGHAAENKLLEDMEHELQLREMELQNLVDNNQASILDPNDDAMEVNWEVPQKNGANGISTPLVDNNQAGTLVLQLYEQEDKSNDPESCFKDKKVSIHEACATIESCFMDEDNELILLVQSSEEKSHVAEKNLLKGMEHGLQLKEMELQNLISASGAANSSVPETVVEEIEEGEISGDAGVSDESDGNMFEDTVSLEQGHTHVSITAEKEFILDVLDTKLQEKHVLTSFSNDSADGCSNISKELLGKKSEVEESDFEMVVCQKDVEKKKIDGFDNVIDSEIVNGQVDGVGKVDSSAACLALKTGSVTDAELEVANEGKRKKKRGPITKENRAKKKCKERIKRAQKNIKLGVKRLKLPPIVKPKTVSYCRHYQKGRCHEGEKCKFSHDIIPLTKSKPCCHFARHSCMKGDDCPFDHQLSKYPCNNFVSNGFCSRGVDCLFSHKVPAKTESSTPPIISKAELSSPLLPSSLSPKMQVNAHGSSQLFPGKNTGHTVGDTVQKLAVRAPKGVSFLTHGKLPVGDTNHKEFGSSLKEGDSGKFNQEEIHSKSDNTQMPNNVIKGPTSRIPHGINFLSLGRAPLIDSSSKTIPSFLNRGYRIEKLQLDEFSKGKDTASSPRIGDSCTNEMTTRTPPKSMPRGISLLAFGKVSLDVTSSTEQAVICNKEYKTASPVVQGIQGSLSRLGGSREMHFKFESSSFPSYQLLGQSAVEHSEGIANSSKTTFLPNIPSSAQKALQSTLAFAAKFESGIKLDQSIGGASVASSNIKEHR
ncbi:uncharacterized protein LOC116019440 isoform X1 [Ipomoea triloba]|uniref:uncharacterized protein LOC116019440 isoform X1 n=1 Tax=Ipomoea triloba TaxID=35885 RepID=UPI00125D6E92|nr:uncharacterized protein LOC116019440 isoform X1 [Ipomoea triloba]XP_031115483.1 uncharacterized protein LOC116019440 isoform X1 [Ipomoea triloba]XP_031115484.1 uncharacterized protein LOC116019440 isoform X1 [Ipomoea triloba]XP_031115485.1 uncharacterized protein LOC116019440 isoform X1 [Ipomoea triloba]XP_031115486.1 uncharacterized protein LOC116019440 isoform X1 [Ipomoea triloba]XP_031115487.1 uncharacterized protein LOC116019440 isoform X1 [Ipomoea triloba]XP_031115488.1 uncharacterize